jgi:nitrogen fixation-related uncharacterized protein
MDILIVLVFVSVVFVCAALLLFFVSLHQRDFEHAERLSLLPLLEPDSAVGAAAPDAAADGSATPAARPQSL